MGKLKPCGSFPPHISEAHKEKDANGWYENKWNILKSTYGYYASNTQLITRNNYE